MIEYISVIGNERIEVNTVASYLTLRVGMPFSPIEIDRSLKSLFSTGLFADITMERNENSLVVRIVENPIVNRVAFEGNNRLDREELNEEVQLRPRMIYTRAKVRSDVQRVIELYRRSGRFAATVEPKIIERDQNRIDLIFEISEGPKSQISKINFIGNETFSDKELKSELVTTEARWWRFLGSNDTYDPDRSNYDRELIRQFYLQRGYADFRVISALAELSPDQQDFFFTLVIEEGEIYKFGKVDVESDIRDISPELFKAFVSAFEGSTYNAKQIEDSIENMTRAAGIFGYAFLDIRPQITRNKEARTLDIIFRILKAPRTYVEKITVQGNVRTLDKVIRREFRIVEGDAFNANLVNRSETRLQSLGFFREVSVERLEGGGPDRVILDVTVEEQSTGELSMGLGYSNFDKFMIDFSISERNLLGKGQELRLSTSYSARSKNVNLGFTEPYFLGRNMAAGVDLFRQTYDSRTESSFKTDSTGGSLRFGFALSEYIRLFERYTLRRDDVDIGAFGGIYSSPFLQGSQGVRTTSSVGYTVSYDTVDSFLRPTRGTRFNFSQDISGLGGSVKYIKSTAEFNYYTPITGKWIFHLGSEMGYIKGLNQNVRINDRFFLGGPKMRGFKIAGVGPRDTGTNDSLGGNLFYTATAGLQIPLGAGVEEMGMRVSAFLDVGSLAKIDLNEFDNLGNSIDNTDIFSNGAPRISLGIGVTWDSPFGPFRIDLAKVIKKQPFDETEFLQFNIGTRF
ncbi:MAG: outer membrane protein assembly factor BamA [Sphingomonadales bacterium]